MNIKYRKGRMTAGSLPPFSAFMIAIGFEFADAGGSGAVIHRPSFVIEVVPI